MNSPVILALKKSTPEVIYVSLYMENEQNSIVSLASGLGQILAIDSLENVSDALIKHIEDVFARYTKLPIVFVATGSDVARERCVYAEVRRNFENVVSAEDYVNRECFIYRSDVIWDPLLGSFAALANINKVRELIKL